MKFEVSSLRVLEDFIDAMMELAVDLGIEPEHVTLTNTQQKIGKVVKEYHQIQETVKELGYSSIAYALRSVKKKTEKAKSISERYNLDDSFLQKIGKRWDKSSDAETHEEIIRMIEKKIARQRDTVRDAYFYCLQYVESVAQEANYTEEQIKQEIEDYHEAMREDFHNLTPTEFWISYRGEFLGAEIGGQKREEQRIPLVHAISLVEKVTPSALRESLKESGDLLGDIPQALFQRWEARAENLKNDASREGRGAYTKLMVEIVGVAIHRLAVKEPGIPNQIQRGTLEQILLPPQYNPYGTENCVGGDTRLRDVVGYYIEHIGPVSSKF